MFLGRGLGGLGYSHKKRVILRHEKNARSDPLIRKLLLPIHTVSSGLLYIKPHFSAFL